MFQSKCFSQNGQETTARQRAKNMTRLTAIRNTTVDPASSLKQILYMIRCCNRTESKLITKAICTFYLMQLKNMTMLYQCIISFQPDIRFVISCRL